MQKKIQFHILSITIKNSTKDDQFDHVRINFLQD